MNSLGKCTRILLLDVLGFEKKGQLRVRRGIEL